MGTAGRRSEALRLFVHALRRLTTPHNAASGRPTITMDGLVYLK